VLNDVSDPIGSGLQPKASVRSVSGAAAIKRQRFEIMSSTLPSITER